SPPSIHRSDLSLPSVRDGALSPPSTRHLEVEAHPAVFPTEREPDPAVQGRGRSLERLPEIFRVIPFLEGQPGTLVRRELLELLPVFLYERQKLGRQSVL